MGLGVLIAGYLGSVNMNYVLVGSVIIAILSVICAVFLPSVKPYKASEETTYLKFFKDSIKTVWSNKLLMQIMIFSILVGISHMVYINCIDFNNCDDCCWKKIVFNSNLWVVYT